MGTAFRSCFWEHGVKFPCSLTPPAVWVTDVMVSAEAASLEPELKTVAIKIILSVLGHTPT